MIEAHWLLFLVASVAIIATPGQDMVLVTSRSITHGTQEGVATSAGVSVGLVGHTLLATAGLVVLLQTSACLLYLGVQLLRTPPPSQLALARRE